MQTFALIAGCVCFVGLLVQIYFDFGKPSKPKNPHGFGLGDDETDYEESNPNR